MMLPNQVYNYQQQLQPHFNNPFQMFQQQNNFLSKNLMTQPITPPTSTSEKNNFCVRFAVNGISKFTKGNKVPLNNRNIQVGDFGDDAGMIAENSRCIVIGLADGAGGNRSIGIDPQVFSRSLLGYCVEVIKNEEILPNQMAKLACKSIQVLEEQNIDGSGTLCLLALNKQNSTMHALNCGDSGFRLVRQGKIVHKSEATMAGSSPKQLYVSESSSYSGISFVNEKEIAQDSDIREFQVKNRDLLILSSDGMFDVVRDSTIQKIVNNHNEKDLQGIADELLAHTMKSYIHTQRDDILIMVCRIEKK